MMANMPAYVKRFWVRHILMNSLMHFRLRTQSVKELLNGLLITLAQEQQRLRKWHLRTYCWHLQTQLEHRSRENLSSGCREPRTLSSQRQVRRSRIIGAGYTLLINQSVGISQAIRVRCHRST